MRLFEDRAEADRIYTGGRGFGEGVVSPFLEPPDWHWYVVHFLAFGFGCDGGIFCRSA